jgi:hypothetical protein
MFRNTATLIHFCVVLLLASHALGGDEPSGDAVAEPWQQHYQQAAAAYQVTRQGTQPQQLQLHPQAVMRWVSINDFNGSLFIWTHNGRPELAGTIFSFPRGDSGARNVMHEFHSLSEASLHAVATTGQEWTIQAIAHTKPVPGAPPVGRALAQRQSQARLLARQFSGHMNRQGERWELRLLNQPIYTYAETDEVLGGALFAVVGYITDPEILLLIEARRTPEGDRWFYTPARFSDKSLWLKHQGVEVWQYLADEPVATPYVLSPAGTVNLQTTGR